MTTQTVRFRTLKERTLTCSLSQDDTYIMEDVSASEYENVLGTYTADFSGLSLGRYWFRAVLPSGTVAEDGWVDITAASGVFDVSQFTEKPYFDGKFDELTSSITSAIGNLVVASVDLSTTDFPKTMRIGDARTVENGAALTIRCYAADDTEYETPLLGVGSLLFDDATSIKIGFTLIGGDTPEVELPIVWYESGGDGYFLLEWDEDALSSVTPFSRGSNKYHEWGIKVFWAAGTQRTVIEGNVKLLPALVSNP